MTLGAASITTTQLPTVPVAHDDHVPDLTLNEVLRRDEPREQFLLHLLKTRNALEIGAQ